MPSVSAQQHRAMEAAVRSRSTLGIPRSVGQEFVNADSAGSRRSTPKRRKKPMAKSGAHPGFKAVQAKIAAKEGVSSKRAGAILAASSRKASPAAKRKNPRLNKVKGSAKPKRSSMVASAMLGGQSSGGGY